MFRHMRTMYGRTIAEGIRREAMDRAGLAAFKQRAQATWAAGDYDEVAAQIWSVGAELVKLVGVSPGERVLDLCTDTGNAAIPAAAAGGRVTGLDIAPELFEDARIHAAEAGVEVKWVEGDAEALPFEDGSFDVVLSTFGCLWGPRHEVTAREIVRVLRRGGRFGLTNWTPEDGFDAIAAAIGRHLPPPPAFASPPPLWGEEEYVRGLFSGLGIELRFERGIVHWRDKSITRSIDRGASTLGPLVKAREMLEPQGRWPELVADLEQWVQQGNVADDGTVDLPQEYLVTLGWKN